MKLPHYAWFPDDYLSSPWVMSCDLIDEAIYRRLLDYQWKHQGCQLPDDIPYLRRLCKGVREARLRNVLNENFERFEVEKGKFYWRNLRLFTEFCRILHISEHNSNNAKSRWNKEKQVCGRNAKAYAKAMPPDPYPDPYPEEPIKSFSRKTQKARFAPPSLEEIKAYCAERKNGVNPETWLDHYTNTGWRVGKFPGFPMKDWKAAVRRWEKNNAGLQTGTSGRPGRNFAAERERERFERVSRICGVPNPSVGVVHGKDAERNGNEVVEGSATTLPDVETTDSW